MEVLLLKAWWWLSLMPCMLGVSTSMYGLTRHRCLCWLVTLTDVLAIVEAQQKIVLLTTLKTSGHHLGSTQTITDRYDHHYTGSMLNIAFALTYCMQTFMTS